MGGRVVPGTRPSSNSSDAPFSQGFLEAFAYWFDYGDDWWRQVDVQAIDEKAPRGKYPKVIKRSGKSPPQYMDEEG